MRSDGGVHDTAITVTADDVRRLLAAQAPQWAELPIAPIKEHGTDHRLFRLGCDLLVRMPVNPGAASQALSDARWLPHVAPYLPVPAPLPQFIGVPDDSFPLPWSIVPWLPGTAVSDPLAPGATGDDLAILAETLGEFVAALQQVDPGDGPIATGTARGVPLRNLDERVRAAIKECGSRIDQRSVGLAWDRSLEQSQASTLTWIHGDLMPGNILQHQGQLTAVIDWGTIAIGDPAVDLIPAWQLFGRSRSARAQFREIATAGLPEPDAAWERGRGWTLAQALIALPYYWDRWPQFARASQRRIAVALDVE